MSQATVTAAVSPAGAVLLGQPVAFDLHVTVAGAPTDAALTVSVILPDGTTSAPSVTHAGTGHYTATFTPATAGHHAFTATTTVAVGVAAGVFDVFDPAPPTTPGITGVNAPWIGAADVARRPEIITAVADGAVITPTTLADAARIATELLYVLTGRQFPGVARTYCRPVARPRGWDARSWGATAAFGYWDSWGVTGGSMGYGAATAPAFGVHNAQNTPPEVPLNYPVRRIEEVKIDGTVIPADEYRVDDYRMLVRTRPTAADQPTARAGWPTTQALTLPDTEPGTFAVTYWYGTGPGLLGQVACATLAAEFALDMVGADNRLPQRLTALNRQGEQITVLDSATALKDMLTGIPQVDYFVKSSNPNGHQRRGAVWSPDLGRRRTPTS